MEYIEIRIDNLTPEVKDLLVFYLGENGFDSFTEDGEDLLAYIPSKWYNYDQVNEICGKQKASFRETLIPDQNWNQEWEKNFEPVVISGRCLVRAPFHPAGHDVEYDIVIMPKMSFGTAHHETTSGVISLMLDLDLAGKRILDMGCGTGVLAILAEKKGAREIVAIDNDEWAFENSVENVARNNCSKISVIIGGAEKIAGKFDVVIANINRNILLGQMKDYGECTSPGSLLVLSGFYEDDLPAIKESAAGKGFSFTSSVSENNWVAAIFTK